MIERLTSGDSFAALRVLAIGSFLLGLILILIATIPDVTIVLRFLGLEITSDPTSAPKSTRKSRLIRGALGLCGLALGAIGGYQAYFAIVRPEIELKFFVTMTAEEAQILKDNAIKVFERDASKFTGDNLFGREVRVRMVNTSCSDAIRRLENGEEVDLVSLDINAWLERPVHAGLLVNLRKDILARHLSTVAGLRDLLPAALHPAIVREWSNRPILRDYFIPFRPNVRLLFVDRDVAQYLPRTDEEGPNSAFDAADDVRTVDPASSGRLRPRSFQSCIGIRTPDWRDLLRALDKYRRHYHAPADLAIGATTQDGPLWLLEAIRAYASDSIDPELRLWTFGDNLETKGEDGAEIPYGTPGSPGSPVCRAGDWNPFAELHEQLKSKFSREFDWRSATGLLYSKEVRAGRSWAVVWSLLRAARAQDAHKKDRFCVFPGIRWPDAASASALASGILGGEVLAIARSSPHKALALALVRHLLTTSVQQTLAGKLAWPTIRVDAQPTAFPTAAEDQGTTEPGADAGTRAKVELAMERTRATSAAAISKAPQDKKAETTTTEAEFDDQAALVGTITSQALLGSRSVPSYWWPGVEGVYRRAFFRRVKLSHGDAAWIWTAAQMELDELALRQLFVNRHGALIQHWAKQFGPKDLQEKLPNAFRASLDNDLDLRDIALCDRTPTQMHGAPPMDICLFRTALLDSLRGGDGKALDALRRKYEHERLIPRTARIHILLALTNFTRNENACALAADLRRVLGRAFRALSGDRDETNSVGDFGWLDGDSNQTPKEQLISLDDVLLFAAAHGYINNSCASTSKQEALMRAYELTELYDRAAQRGTLVSSFHRAVVEGWFEQLCRRHVGEWRDLHGQACRRFLAHSTWRDYARSACRGKEDLLLLSKKHLWLPRELIPPALEKYIGGVRARGDKMHCP